MYEYLKNPASAVEMFTDYNRMLTLWCDPNSKVQLIKEFFLAVLKAVLWKYVPPLLILDIENNSCKAVILIHWVLNFLTYWFWFYSGQRVGIYLNEMYGI